MGNCCGSDQEERRSDDHAYEVYRSQTTRHVSTPTRQQVLRPNQLQGPVFGKFRCKTCNRTWVSRLAWLNKYQICKKCRKPVYPYTHRELSPSDFGNDLKESKEHQEELCQMCQQLGHLCTKNYRLPKNNYRRT